MTPKSPDQLRKELERQNEQPAKPGHERTAEGMEAPVPSKRELLANLEKLAKPKNRPDP
jgi:hypothetical protein